MRHWGYGFSSVIINCRQIHFLCLRTAYGAELQMFGVFFSLFFSNSALIRPHMPTTTIQTELKAVQGRREGGFRVVHYGHSSFRRYIVNGSLMATVAMATLLEQLLPTTSQKIRDVIFEDKTSPKANTEFLHRRKTGTHTHTVHMHAHCAVSSAPS